MSGTNFPNGIKNNGKTLTGNTTIAAVALADVEGAASTSPSQAEYALTVALLNSTKAQLNSVIATLKTVGIIL